MFIDVWFVFVCTLAFLLCGTLCICDHWLPARLFAVKFKVTSLFLRGKVNGDVALSRYARQKTREQRHDAPPDFFTCWQQLTVPPRGLCEFKYSPIQIQSKFLMGKCVYCTCTHTFSCIAMFLQDKLVSECAGNIDSIKRVKLILDEEELEDHGLTALSAADRTGNPYCLYHTHTRSIEFQKWLTCALWRLQGSSSDGNSCRCSRATCRRTFSSGTNWTLTSAMSRHGWTLWCPSWRNFKR